MKEITLGSTGITVPQNGFGALPIQRADEETAIKILRKAYEGGIRFFDTARAYSDSEEKVGKALSIYPRESYYIATKSMARNPEEFRKQLDQSLELLKTDYIDIFQFHWCQQVYKPNDGTGMYEAMLEAKQAGKIRHIGITSHLLSVGHEAIDSGLYETLQFPLSYISSQKDIELAQKAIDHGMGFIAMKGLAGGLLHNTDACIAFMHQSDFLPIWGIQRESELDMWLSYFEKEVTLTEELKEFIEKEKKQLAGDFCRGCGYCMPCPVGIQINTCARMSLLLRRSPSQKQLSEQMQAEMMKIENCLHCGRCKSRCPYQLDTPSLLQKNLEDYKNVLSGKTKV